MVTLYNEGWDAHSDVKGNHTNNCKATDQPCAALIRDLERRGLLEDTLVVWGGEFGRTPMVESNPTLGRKQGRDHHPQAFTVWMAGGGAKPGVAWGQTDELGFHVVDNAVHIHDLQATILHLMGIDHERLTYFHQGREFRLTDVHGRVVSDLIA
jgi:arylsulfatase A-like enzyme